ncbi:MAG: hypothetical protein AAFU73_08280 [Planctomycetota bacterium]
MVTFRALLTPLALVPLAVPASAQCGLERILPEGGFEDTIAWGVSDDGTTVVGASYFGLGPADPSAFTWTAATGLVPLMPFGSGASEALAVSADGSVIVGRASDSGSDQPVLWSASAAPVSLLDGTGLGGSGQATDVSADGSTVVGWTFRSGTIRSFRWTASGGVFELPLPIGFNRVRAEGVSADGSVVVGSMQNGFSAPRAYRWTAGGGFVDITPAGASSAAALDVSADGATVVGHASFPGAGQRGVRWDASGAASTLGNAFGSSSSARAVSSDGRSVAGSANSAFDASTWSPETGGVDAGVWVPDGGYFTDVSDGGVHVGLTYYGPVGESYAIVWRASEVGATYCEDAVPNSTGCVGRLSAEGSASVASNDLTLRASSLPPSVFGLFLSARAIGSTPQPGGSTGTLCLAGPIGRFNAPGQVQSSGAAGELLLALDLTALPTPNALVAAATGETWSFQAWHRTPGGTGSNFTDAVALTLR